MHRGEAVRGRGGGVLDALGKGRSLPGTAEVLHEACGIEGLQIALQLQRVPLSGLEVWIHRAGD